MASSPPVPVVAASAASARRRPCHSRLRGVSEAGSRRDTPFPGDCIMGFKVAVVGATGNVGREMLSILAEHGFPAEDVTAVASERSAGGQVSYGEDDVLNVEDLDRYHFRGIDIALFSPGAKVSAAHAARAAKAGTVVIA